jgi:hypothetical protein
MESAQLKYRSRLVGAGAMVLPVLGVLCVGYLSPKPSTARAKQVAATTSEDARLSIPDGAWLQSWSRGDAPAEIEGSPFPVEVVADMLPDTYELEQAPVAEEEPEPTIKLTGIMRISSGDVAMIDGRALGLGASIEGAWIVGSIDPSGRSITAVNERDGREIVFRLPGS